jgi:hypothetical protein
MRPGTDVNYGAVVLRSPVRPIAVSSVLPVRTEACVIWRMFPYDRSFGVVYGFFTM